MYYSIWPDSSNHL